MLKITTTMLKSIIGSSAIKGTKMLSQTFDQLLYIFKSIYPSSKVNDSITMAFSAMEFVLNAEVYFIEIASKSGRSFFADNKNLFTKHFNYDSIVGNIQKDAEMLFLYDSLSDNRRKLAAHGVIGRFQSFDCSYEHNNFKNECNLSQDPNILITLEISNKGIIKLSISDMIYFGQWHSRRLELII